MQSKFARPDVEQLETDLHVVYWQGRIWHIRRRPDGVQEVYLAGQGNPVMFTDGPGVVDRCLAWLVENWRRYAGKA